MSGEDQVNHYLATGFEYAEGAIHYRWAEVTEADERVRHEAQARSIWSTLDQREVIGWAADDFIEEPEVRDFMGW